MGDVQRQQVEYLCQRRDGEREARFKITRNIPKITAEGGTNLLDEFDLFESTFAKTNPQSAKDWAITLDDALDGKAKSWRDYCVLCDPGRTFHQATLVVGATENHYRNYYQYIRGELLALAGLEHENPGESTKKRWDNIRIPGNLRFQEDLDEVLETVNNVYHQLAKHGMILPGYELDERRLVIDLGIKMERGTEFRTWFYGTDGHQGVNTVRAWIDRAQKYRSLLAHTRKEAVLDAVEVGFRDGDWDEPAGGNVGSEELGIEDEIDEVIGRLNDWRQARMGGEDIDLSPTRSL
jgi:hypothetical protein